MIISNAVIISLLLLLLSNSIVIKTKLKYIQVHTSPPISVAFPIFFTLFSANGHGFSRGKFDDFHHAAQKYHQHVFKNFQR